MKTVAVLLVVTLATACHASFVAYPAGLMHRSTPLRLFQPAESQLKTFCEEECLADPNCDGFLLIDGFCRQLIEKPLVGGLVHHGKAFGLFRTNSRMMHQVFRRTNDDDFLAKEGIHDCNHPEGYCSETNSRPNSCVVYGECVCKPGFIGPTCSESTADCDASFAELEANEGCPCGTILEKEPVSLSGLEDDDDASAACLPQSSQAALAPIATLSECASRLAETAKLEQNSLLRGTFRRAGVGTLCVAPIGQEPGPGDNYTVSSPEACIQEAGNADGFQYNVATGTCLVFNKLNSTTYQSDSTSSCFVNHFFEFNDGTAVKVITHEKTIDLTSRVTTCLVSSEVTATLLTPELTFKRIKALKDVAGSFAYKASDSILVMQNKRLQNRLEDQLLFMSLTFDESSNFFCRTLCPCGTYSLSSSDAECSERHITFRSGLEHVRAQMNCVFREDWNASDPTQVAVLLNAMTCAASYRDADDNYLQGVLQEGRARVALALNNVLQAQGNTSTLVQLLPGSFVNKLNVLLERVSSPSSSESFSVDGAASLLEMVQSLQSSTTRTLTELEGGSIVGSDGKVREDFRQTSVTFDQNSKSVLQALSENRATKTQDVLERFSMATNALVAAQKASEEVLSEFKTDLAEYIEKFPGTSPKFDKEVERSNAAFQLFQSLFELVSTLFQETYRLATSGISFEFPPITPVKPGTSDLDRFRHTITRFKVLSAQEVSLDKLFQALKTFHNDWHALTTRNDGQVIDLDSSSSYGRLRELMMAIASTASYNAYVSLHMVHVLDARYSIQDPVWKLSSSGSELLEAILVRFNSLFVHELAICPQPLSPEPGRKRGIQQRLTERGGLTLLQDSLKGKTSDVLYSCAKFHRALGNLVSKASLAFVAMYDVVASAQREIHTMQDQATESSLSFFLDKVVTLPEPARNPFMALFFRDRLLHVQARWARYMERLCNLFKSSTADLIPGLTIGGSFSLGTQLCSVSDNSGISRKIVPGMILAWQDVLDVHRYGPMVCTLNSDGTVTGFYNGTSRVGDMSSVASLLENVVDLRGNDGAFAALRSDGRVVAWGHPFYGGDISSIPELESGVERLFDARDIPMKANERTFVIYGPQASLFAAQKRDGSLVLWGSNTTYGVFEDVADVVIGHRAAVVIHRNRTVTTWGEALCGGDSSSVKEQLVDVDKVYYTAYLSSDIIVDPFRGIFDIVPTPSGNWMIPRPDGALVAATRVCELFEFTFWVLKKDGTAVAWSKGEQHGANTPRAKELLLAGNIVEMLPKLNGVAFMRKDRSVFAVGPAEVPVEYFNNGTHFVAKGFVPSGADSSKVDPNLLRNVKSLHRGFVSFAVLREDGSVVAWGANDTELGAGDTSSVASFVSKDIVQVTEGFHQYCAVNGQGEIKCWGRPLRLSNGSKVTSLRDTVVNYDEVEPLLESGVQSRSDGGFEVYAEMTDYQGPEFLARRRVDGSFVHWGFPKMYASARENLFLVPSPDVPVRSVSFTAKAILLEDGTVVNFKSDLSTSQSFEQQKDKLTDVIQVIGVDTGFFFGAFFAPVYELSVAQSADGRLVAWGRSALASKFENANVGSEVDTVNKLSSTVGLAQGGLKGATDRWLRPLYPKQAEQVEFQPSCKISDSTFLSALLKNREAQTIDVSVSSFERFCPGNVGVKSVQLLLLDDQGESIVKDGETVPLRFKIQAVSGAHEFKYFALESFWLEATLQRQSEGRSGEYYMDFSSGESTQQDSLGASGSVLPSPFTKWTLSLETPWPEEMDFPASISLSFTLVGGDCLEHVVDLASIRFDEERSFLNDLDTLTLAATCGGTSLPEAPPPVVPTVAPTGDAGGDGSGEPQEDEAADAWIVPVAASVGAVVALAAVAGSAWVLKRRSAESSQLSATIPKEDLI